MVVETAEYSRGGNQTRVPSDAVFLFHRLITYILFHCVQRHLPETFSFQDDLILIYYLGDSGLPCMVDAIPY